MSNLSKKDLFKEELLKIKQEFYHIKKEAEKNSEQGVIDRYKIYIEAIEKGPKSRTNVAIAFLDDVLPEGYNQIIFACSKFNEVTSRYDKKLKKELDDKGVTICERPEVSHLFYKFKRLNEKLEFVDSMPEGFVKEKNNCCERKIIEYIKAEHIKEMQKVFDNAQFKGEKREKYIETVGMTGSLIIYTNMEPCIYCYSLLKEFKDDNPHLRVQVSYNELDEEGKDFFEIYSSYI